MVVGAPLISLTSVLQASRSLVSWWVSAMVSFVQSFILSSHLSLLFSIGANLSILIVSMKTGQDFLDTQYID